MEEARKRLRICLICIVAIAVIIGGVYYLRETSREKNPSEGTLVMAEAKDQEMCYGWE